MVENKPQTDRNYQYLKDHWDELFQKWPQKFIIISDQKVIGFYDSYEAAATKAITELGDEEFIIQQLTDVKPLNFIFVA
ncbi:MAG TPA: hypothetical protein VN285_05155 [Candidatus Deferrimicrobium sp.]|nr:hypothetical protein [Candidatus Deferrimicrobium sp.]